MMRKLPLSLHINHELAARLEAERERMSSAAGTEISRNAAVEAVLKRGLQQENTAQPRQ